MLNQSTFYCDESGNTGFNLLDASQPFYVTGGVLVPRTAHPRLAATLEHVRSGASERKAATLLKTPEGRQAIAHALDEAFGIGCVPFYVISEKRFNVAQKIVDVLFDPIHNEAAGWLALNDDVERDRVENQLCTLSPLLDAFLEAYREPQIEVWKDVVGSLQRECEKREWEKLAATFKGALDHIDTIFKHEQQAGHEFIGGGSSRHFHFASIQVPMFLHVVRLVDGVLERHHARGVVCHDASPKFEAAFQTAFAWIKGTSGESVAWTSGTYRRLGMTQIDSLTFADSESSMGLQLSDLLVGLVRWVMIQAANPPPSGVPAFPRTAYRLLGQLIGDSPLLAGTRKRGYTVKFTGEMRA
jgi:hypothetical protein